MKMLFSLRPEKYQADAEIITAAAIEAAIAYQLGPTRRVASPTARSTLLRRPLGADGAGSLFCRARRNAIIRSRSAESRGSAEICTSTAFALTGSSSPSQ